MITIVKNFLKSLYFRTFLPSLNLDLPREIAFNERMNVYSVLDLQTSGSCPDLDIKTDKELIYFRGYQVASTLACEQLPLEGLT